MSEQGQPNNQQAVNNPPTLPAPQDPGWMQRSDPNDLTFMLNEESGNMEIVPKSQLSQPQQVDQQFQAAVENANVSSATLGGESNQQQSDPYASRIAQLEQGIGIIANYLQGLENQKLNNLTPQTTQEQQTDYSNLDLQDPNTIVAIINRAIDEKFKQVSAPMQQAVDQVKVKNSFDYAAAKYGQDFLNVLPKIQILIQNGILKSDPNTSFEALYLAFKQMENLNGNTAKSDSTIQTGNGHTQNGVKPQPVQQLVQRANALSTETGGVQRSIINQDKPKIGSVDDAVNAAWDQLFGGKV